MNSPTPIERPVRAQLAAFSLIEIMVAVSLLTLIVLGLVFMFSQTQRAFVTSMAQVDVLENGRAISDLLSSELAEMAPTHLPLTTNFLAEYDDVSFVQPLYQELPPGGTRRTNVVQRFFFLTRENQDWIGHGYYVLPPYGNAGVGALYRHVTSARGWNASLLSSNFFHALRNGLVTNRVADGIVHLRLIPYDVKGRRIDPFSWTNTASVNVTNGWSPVVPGMINYYFLSNAVPASVELEVGILEKEAYERFKALGNANAVNQRGFLSNSAAQVHLFRQRIPIRNVDPSVYK